MALHQRTHPEPVDGCFACKIIGLNFGTVPGGYRDLSGSDALLNMDSLEEQLSDDQGPLFSEERVKDNQSDAMAKIRDFNEASAEIDRSGV